MRSDRWNLGVKRRDSLWRRLSPPQLLVGSFLILIGLGTFALKLLPGVTSDPSFSWLDALFTATSAVCVTGLIVVDTATAFTPLGQGIVLALIQLGGLGIIGFTTVVVVALGRRLSLRHESLATSLSEVAPQVDYRRLMRDIFWFTFTIEAAGALLLYLFWIPRFGATGAIWPAIFHAISAFCNAGFSTFSDSLMGFQAAPLTQLVIMALVVVGGLGFLTLEEIRMYRRAGRRFRISIHSRLVLTTTLVLSLGGGVFFTLFEWEEAFGALPAWAKVLNGLFLSITARTAGFNTIDYALASDNTNFLTMILMFIGGAPGSMAGGVKVTVAALIGLLAWSRIRGHTLVSLWSRTIPQETIQRSVGVFVMAASLITLAIFLFTTTEAAVAEHRTNAFLGYAFEAVSAFNTVGLSMGVTYELTPLGRITTIVLMFVGRVGLLTFAASLARRALRPEGGFRYAHEDVLIG